MTIPSHLCYTRTYSHGGLDYSDRPPPIRTPVRRTHFTTRTRSARCRPATQRLDFRFGVAARQDNETVFPPVSVHTVPCLSHRRRGLYFLRTCAHIGQRKCTRTTTIIIIVRRRRYHHYPFVRRLRSAPLSLSLSLSLGRTRLRELHNIHDR